MEGVRLCPACQEPIAELADKSNLCGYDIANATPSTTINPDTLATPATNKTTPTWYIKDATGKVNGPLTQETIEERIYEGKITLDTLLMTVVLLKYDEKFIPAEVRLDDRLIFQSEGY